MFILKLLLTFSFLATIINSRKQKEITQIHRKRGIVQRRRNELPHNLRKRGTDHPKRKRTFRQQRQPHFTYCDEKADVENLKCESRKIS